MIWLWLSALMAIAWATPSPCDAGIAAVENAAARVDKEGFKALAVQVEEAARSQRTPACEALIFEVASNVACAPRVVEEATSSEPLEHREECLAWLTRSFAISPSASVARKRATVMEQRLEPEPDAATARQIEEVARAWTLAYWMALQKDELRPVPSTEVDLAALGALRFSLGIMASRSTPGEAEWMSLALLAREVTQLWQPPTRDLWRASYGENANSADMSVFQEYRTWHAWAAAIPPHPSADGQNMARALLLRVMLWRRGSIPQILTDNLPSPWNSMVDEEAFVRHVDPGLVGVYAEIEELRVGLAPPSTGKVWTEGREAMLQLLVANHQLRSQPGVTVEGAEGKWLRVGRALTRSATASHVQVPNAERGGFEPEFILDQVLRSVWRELSPLLEDKGPGQANTDSLVEGRLRLEQIAQDLLKLRSASPLQDMLLLQIGLRHPDPTTRIQALRRVKDSSVTSLLSAQAPSGLSLGQLYRLHVVTEALIREERLLRGGLSASLLAEETWHVLDEVHAALLSEDGESLRQSSIEDPMACRYAHLLVRWLEGHTPTAEGGRRILDELRASAGPLSDEECAALVTEAVEEPPSRDYVYQYGEVPLHVQIDKVRLWIEEIDDLVSGVEGALSRLGASHALRLAVDELLSSGEAAASIERLGGLRGSLGEALSEASLTLGRVEGACAAEPVVALAHRLGSTLDGIPPSGGLEFCRMDLWVMASTMDMTGRPALALNTSDPEAEKLLAWLDWQLELALASSSGRYGRQVLVPSPTQLSARFMWNMAYDTNHGGAINGCAISDAAVEHGIKLYGPGVPCVAGAPSGPESTSWMGGQP